MKKSNLDLSSLRRMLKPLHCPIIWYQYYVFREEIIARIEDVIVQVVYLISTGAAPELKIR